MCVTPTLPAHSSWHWPIKTDREQIGISAAIKPNYQGVTFNSQHMRPDDCNQAFRRQLATRPSA
jgi:hypothetical protein